MKRENKAYSYKEQIIELELQEVNALCHQEFSLHVSKPGTPTDFPLIFQELKKKKGIKEEVQLTSKQKEMVQIQLDKEASIRKRLQGVCNIL